MHVLDALVAQDVPDEWSARLIVSSDGSLEDVPSIVRSFAWKRPWQPPVLLEGVHRGRSYARNRAIDAATADVVLLLADDIILRPRALAKHMEFHDTHRNGSDAALGCIVWDPRLPVTPFMEWMMHGGQQNDYDAILGARTCDSAQYFYGSFLSLKRAYLGNERFSEEFSRYGWEDLELGGRLGQKGLQLFVLHESLALHRHFYGAKAILDRQKVVGSAAYRVNTNAVRRIKHEVYRMSGARWLVRYCMEKWGDSLNIPRFFAFATAGEFWYGVHHSNKVVEKK